MQREDGWMHQLLAQYVPLVHFLAQALGENVEIALHDMTCQDGPIVALANGQSGREVGSKLTNLGKHIIEEKQYLEQDFVMNYKSLSQDGKLLRSSSYFIKDTEGNLVGMLCVNVNISDYAYINQALQRILGISTKSEMEYEMENPIEILSNDLQTTISQYCQEALSDMGCFDSSRLTAKEKQHVVEYLNKKGVFQMKGAIHIVANVIHSSTPTIYRYLQNIRGGTL